MENNVPPTTKEDLINELILVEGIKDELWQYHPNNPDRTDLVKYYEDLCKESLSLNTLIEAADHD